MMSSVIPARLEFQCGHAALVSLPRIKGETSAQRNERITREKAAAQGRACDFCGPDVAIVVQAAAPEPASDAVAELIEAEVEALEAVEAQLETLADVEAVAELDALAEAIVAEAEAVVAEAEAVVAEAEAGVSHAVVADGIVPEAELVPVELVTVVAPSDADGSARPRRARMVRTSAPELRQFTVQYRVERVIAASDIADALRRVTALGATDVLAISRE